jgi:gluconolactonase
MERFPAYRVIVIAFLVIVVDSLKTLNFQGTLGKIYYARVYSTFNQISMFHTIWDVKIIQDMLDHPECLNFGPSGRLIAGGEAGQIYSIDIDKGSCEQIANTEGFVIGVVVDGEENIYACDMKKHCVFRVNLDGKIVEYCRAVEGENVLTPNYALFDDSGNLYFTDSGDYWKSNGRLVRVAPDGVATSLLGNHLSFPNGLALSLSGERLFLIESTSAKVVSLKINKDGTVDSPEMYVQLQGSVPDGMAFDREGNLYIACYAPDIIYKVDTRRNVTVLIEDRTGEILNRPTNVAFNPDGSPILYFSNLGGWHIGSLDVDLGGQKLRYPRFSK